MSLPQTCQLCGSPTPANALVGEWYPYANAVSKAARCFQCYALETAIRVDPERAYQILDTLRGKTGMRILNWEGKHGGWLLAARTDDELDRAYLKLFQHLDENGYYEYGLDGDQPDWYDKAKDGDAEAARWLLELRSDLGYEYERVSLDYAETP